MPIHITEEQISLINPSRYQVYLAFNSIGRHVDTGKKRILPAFYRRPGNGTDGANGKK